jgi:uncharacterized protein (DUF58 family)
MIEESRALYRKYLDPRTLDKITATELKARRMVEGFMMGLNKSPIRGFSVDFKQHREYVHGDDPRYLDWKVWGRTNRLMIKEFEQETNARVHLVLDASRSMKYGSKDTTKFEYATMGIAALGYLSLLQRDWVTFTCFSKGLQHHVPGSTSRHHLSTILQEIEKTKPDGETDFGTSLKYLAEKIQRRGIVIVASDFFDEPASIASGLRFLRAKRHDVIVLQVLDQFELEFPFKQLTLFEGIELPEKKLTDPRAIREAYLSALNAFVTEIQRTCQGLEVDYVQLGTHQNLDAALTAYLVRRQKMTG